MMSNSVRVTTLLLALSLAGPAFAEPDSALVLSLGRESGWKDFSTLSGAGFQRAKDGTLDLTLASAQYQAGDDTDLLVHFDDKLRDEASRYRIAPEPNPVRRGFSAVGGGSAAFRGRSPLVLQATANALLAPGRGLGDFTIEFWLYPTRVDDGETVFEWQGGRVSSGAFETQDLRAAFQNGRLVWTLQNIFAPTPIAPAVTVTVSGGSLLIPGQWHHHLLRYRAGTGLLEYLVDGKTEGLVHATPSGTEDGRPYGAVIGPRTKGEVTLGGNYDGALDELRISRSWVEQPQTDRYIDGLSQKGTAVSRIFDLRFPGSTVESVRARVTTEGNSNVIWSYRMADTVRYQWQFSGDTARSLAAPEAEEDSWIRFNPKTTLNPGDDLSRKAAGRYLQLRVDLLPSGTGIETPRVNQIVVTTRPSPPPPTPANLEVIPGDGQLTIRWKPVLQGGTEGYLVFFGPRSGQTQGAAAAQGTSPLDVGKVTQVVLSGLLNDQIYYVSVAAYRSSAVSAPSAERSARPQKGISRE